MILGKIRAGEAIEHYITTRTAKDGTKKLVSLAVSPVRDANGKVVAASRRTKVTAGQLYALLNAEFAAKRSVASDTCRVPLPMRIERPDPVSANWRIGTPRECEHKCHLLILELAATFWPRFDLPEEEPAKVAAPEKKSSPLAG